MYIFTMLLGFTWVNKTKSHTLPQMNRFEFLRKVVSLIKSEVVYRKLNSNSR